MSGEESDFDFEAELAGMDDIATGSKLLPEADYNWQVVATSTTTSSNGNPAIVLHLEIIDGPYRGKRMIHNIYYSSQKQSGIEFFWRQMKALGMTSEWVRATGNTKIARMAELAQNVQLVAAIKHETYQEVERAKTQLKSIIGSNPNIAGAGAGAKTLTGVAQPPAANSLPPLEDDEETPPPAAAKEPVTVPAAAPTEGTTDDPWGTDN
jgi:hypothetical protein